MHFWWTLTIVLCACFAILSWTFVPYVFNNPHKPLNYTILEKLGRLPKIKEFKALNPPDGKIGNPKQLYKDFNAFTPKELEKLNDELVKNYIGNFKEHTLNAYVRGEYRVIKTRSLTDDDVFSNGVAVHAEAMVKNNQYSDAKPYLVWIEIILPNAPADTVNSIRKGDKIVIDKNPHYLSVLHAQRIERSDDDPIFNFTIVPLVYESPWNPPHGSPFTMKAPAKLNLEGSFPIFPL